MKKKTTYILIDASGSMHGPRADAVNVAMKEVIEDIVPEVMNQKDADVEPYLAVLTFKTSPHDIKNVILDWVVPKCKMEEISEWAELDQEYFSGGTPTGEAIEKLIKDINEGCYGDVDPDAVAPAILLISDGMPNGELLPYEEALRFADKDYKDYCPDYAHANRIAIGIQVDESGKQSLQKFGRLSGSMKNFNSYYDCTDDRTEMLIELIKNCTLGLSVN